MTDVLSSRRLLRYTLTAFVVLGAVGVTSYLITPETEYTFRTVFISMLAVVSFVSKYALASLGNDSSAKAEGDDGQVRTDQSQEHGVDNNLEKQVCRSDVHAKNPVSVDDLFESDSGPSAEAQLIHPRLQNMKPVAFEKFVAALFERQGWTVEQSESDHGIDLFASQSSGLVEHEVAVCLKQYPEDVKISTAETRRLAGLKADLGTDLLVITTSSFTDSAREDATRLDIQTVDGPELETFIHDREEYELFDQFAPAIETVTRSGPIPASEIPQADSIEILNQVLQAIESG